MLTAAQDPVSVTPHGEVVQKLPAGVSFHDIQTHVDDRGSLCELFDTRWEWHKAPLVFAYHFTVRPGIIKGWAVHQKHEDRYIVLYGDLEVVLFDDRPDSPTRGLVSKINLSEFRRRLMNIPIGVWHAIRNIGTKDVLAINFPTTPYEHEDPDKYRLPVNTDKIPHKFDNPRGG